MFSNFVQRTETHKKNNEKIIWNDNKEKITFVYSFTVWENVIKMRVIRLLLVQLVLVSVTFRSFTIFFVSFLKSRLVQNNNTIVDIWFRHFEHTESAKITIKTKKCNKNGKKITQITFVFLSFFLRLSSDFERDTIYCTYQKVTLYSKNTIKTSFLCFFFISFSLQFKLESQNSYSILCQFFFFLISNL